MDFDKVVVAYLTVVLLALGVALYLRARGLRALEYTGSERDPELTRVYETAFLAGGVRRCCQLALTRLLHGKAISMSRAGSGQTRVKALIPALPTDADDVDQAVFTGILKSGQNGVLLREIGPLIRDRLQGIESRLASSGLRPTQAELRSVSWRAAVPLLVAMVIGLGLGVPMKAYLMVTLVAIASIVVLVAVTNNRHLTSRGQDFLTKLRTNYQPPMDWHLGLALLGPVFLLGYGQDLGLDSAEIDELKQMGRAASADGGGSGCSSGCSSCSSCGGGDGGGDGGGCGSSCGGGGD